MKKLYILVCTTVTTLLFSQITNPQQLLNTVFLFNYEGN